jgi:hypothetical protein
MADSAAVPSRRSIAARANGRKGGMATAKNHSPEWLSQRGKSGGTTTRDLYSVDFFRHAQQLRKIKRGWPQGKLRTKAVRVAKEAINNAGLSPASTQFLNALLVQNG